MEIVCIFTLSDQKIIAECETFNIFNKTIYRYLVARYNTLYFESTVIYSMLLVVTCSVI